MDKLSEIIETISNLRDQKQLTLIAIDGNGGGGKTTLSKHIRSRLPGVRVLRTDLYPSPKGDDPNLKAEYLCDQLLLPLINSEVAAPQIFDWPNKKFIDGPTIEPKGIVVLEGTLTMHEKLINFYDYKIWVECPPEIGMNRALERDNDAYKEKWKNEWLPRMQSYVSSQNPQLKADIIIDYKEISEFKM